MTTKTFAPNYPRTPEGWIKFPRDIELRKSLFTPEVMKHPAKINLHLLRCIIDYVSLPGDTILDCMSGTGSLMIATLPPYNCSVWLIEDAPVFHYEQTLSKSKFMALGVPEESINLMQGPCQEYLPLAGFFDHIIFSPPYANVLIVKAVANSTKALAGTYISEDVDGFDDYRGSSAKNLGRMSAFHYNQEMSKIYRMLWESLRPGGTMTVVVQDMMKAGVRNGLSDWVMRTCIRSGFELLNWFKRYSPGTGMKKLHRSKGVAVIDDEDVLILAKP